VRSSSLIDQVEILGTSGRAKALTNTPMNFNDLKEACKGVVATAGDANFTELLHGNLWNRLIPDRAPLVLVRVIDEQDVIAAVLFARANKLKVVVRGGGHNWCQPTLRNGGVLIDLTNLNKVISIDPIARKAVVQPIVSNRDAQRALNPLGMAFPSGHCPQVKLSGYLLGGGMAWNQGAWGHGCESIESIEMVTAEGKLITASKDENQDYFWAACGAGSGFFGVVTRFQLKLYPLPKAIHGCSYFYPMEEAASVATWLEKIAGTLATTVELSLLFMTAPTELKDKTARSGGKICLVTGVSFAETSEQALAELKPLADCPVSAKSLGYSSPAPVTFEELFDASGALWPEQLRSRVEAAFTNAPAGQYAQIAAAHLMKAPSPISLILLAFFTGPVLPPALPDAAFSMTARIYGGPWSQWRSDGEDEANTKWHNALIDDLAPFNSGYYIGEANTVEKPSKTPSAFLPENWKRLADLRDKYDPDGVFFGYFDGLNDTKAGSSV
jgi:FAD/FMN-containing dehydrogenase